MAGIPSSSGASPGTTKNFYLTLLSLCLNFTAYTPKCLISDWLYVFNNTELFFVAYKLAVVDFRNRILNILNGMKLPLLPVCILYIIWTPFWVVLDSNLVKITDFKLSKFKYLIFYVKIPATVLALPCVGIVFLLDFMDCLISLR